MRYFITFWFLSKNVNCSTLIPDGFWKGDRIRLKNPNVIIWSHFIIKRVNEGMKNIQFQRIQIIRSCSMVRVSDTYFPTGNDPICLKRWKKIGTSDQKTTWWFYLNSNSQSFMHTYTLPICKYYQERFPYCRCPRVNFTNILRAAFSCESFAQNFFVLRF